MVFVVSTVVSVGVVVGTIEPKLGLMFVLALTGGEITLELVVTWTRRQRFSIWLRKKKA